MILLSTIRYNNNVLANLFGQTLIPNRRPAELRPFVEEPPAFFFAPRIPPSRRSSQQMTSVVVIFVFVKTDDSWSMMRVVAKADAQKLLL
jgi:hypothetical protein